MLWIDQPDAIQKIHALDENDNVKNALLSLQKDGYCVLRGAIPKGLCDDVITGFHAWEARNVEECATKRRELGRLPRLTNLHMEVDALKGVFTASKDTLAVQDLYFGSEAVLYTCLYYEQGSAQPYHRDAPYFTTRPVPHQFLGVWYAFESADATNGALRVIPGAHRIDGIDPYEIASRHFASLREVPPISDALWIDYQDTVAARCRDLGLAEHDVFVGAGDVVMWHALMPHQGSPIINKERSRHSVAMHTIPYGTSVYYGDVYFNPDANPEPKAWSYLDAGHGRRMIDHGPAHFG